MKASADAIEKNIAAVDKKFADGFWECENGHEPEKPLLNGTDSFSCPECLKPAKHIKRSEMTQQEQYEADKEKREAEKIVAACGRRLKGSRKRSPTTRRRPSNF
jgi:hypothetical protein